MNERLRTLRSMLNEPNNLKKEYQDQIHNAEDMIEEINFRVDELNTAIEFELKGVQVS